MSEVEDFYLSYILLWAMLFEDINGVKEKQ